MSGQRQACDLILVNKRIFPDALRATKNNSLSALEWGVTAAARFSSQEGGASGCWATVWSPRMKAHREAAYSWLLGDGIFFELLDRALTEASIFGYISQ